MLLNTCLQQYLDIPVVSCSMFRKGAPTDQTSTADYIGFSIPDDFIVGVFACQWEIQPNRCLRSRIVLNTNEME